MAGQIDSPPPPETARAGIAGSSKVAAAATPSTHPAACLPRSCGAAAHCTRVALGPLRCCLKHCGYRVEARAETPPHVSERVGFSPSVPAPLKPRRTHLRCGQALGGARNRLHRGVTGCRAAGLPQAAEGGRVASSEFDQRTGQ